MQIGSLINHAVPEISQQNTIGEALDKMELLKLNQLPVVDQNQFKGLVYEDKLLDVFNTDSFVGVLPNDAISCYVFDNQHYLDALKVAQIHKSEIIAVLDPNQNYLGVATTSDITTYISTQYFIQQQGATLVLSMFERDYSLSELSRLIENNNLKILASFVESDIKDSTKVLVTLKLNQINYSSVAATFERFNYVIVEQYGEILNTNSDLDRLGSFLRYLNV